MFDANETEIEIQTNRLQFFIPRDPNLIIPDMFLHSVTLTNQTKQLFHYHLVHLPSDNPNVTLSIHLELHPLNGTPAYIIAYQFDEQTNFESTKNWSLLCPVGKI